MKRYIFMLFAALILASCSPVISNDTGLYVYNSKWESIDPDSLVASNKAIASPRAIQVKAADVISVEDAVKAYNAETIDDQLFIYAEEVPIEESPNAWGYICDSATLECYFSLEVPRTDFVDRKTAWEMTTSEWSDGATGEKIACTLYIDHIPDEVPIVIPPEPKLYLALIDYTDHIIAYSENWPTEAEAATRYSAYSIQRDANEQADGHDWRVYWDVAPFAWPTESEG